MNKKKSIIWSAILVIAFMLGSKVLGFFRQIIIAASFGANSETDIFFVSSEFMTGLSMALSGSLISALVTIYIDVSIKKNKREANSIASKVMILFLMIGGGITFLINLFTPQIAKLLAPACGAENLATLVQYLRIFSVVFIFSGMQSVFTAILNANDSFIPNQLYGVLYNPLVILFVVIAGQKWGFNALLAAFLIAQVLQTVLLYFLSKKEFKFIPSFSLKDQYVRKLIRISLPLIMCNVFVQLNVVINKAICSTLGEGVVSNYSYANTLEQFVTATITSTLSLVLLSHYTTYVAEENTKMVIKTFRNSIEGLVLLLAPITAVVLVQAHDIVEIVYLRGEFDQTAAAVTARVLMGFAPGLILVAIRELYTRLHFSFQNTKAPMIANGVACIFSGILSVMLSRFFGPLGVSVATSVSIILTIVILNRTIKGYLPEFHLTGMAIFFGKIGLAGVLGGVVAYFACGLMEELHVILRFGFGALICGGIYLGVLFLLRCKELYAFINSVFVQIKAKFKKA